MNTSIVKSLGLLVVSVIIFPSIAWANVEGNNTPEVEQPYEAAPTAPATLPIETVSNKPVELEKISTVNHIKQAVSTVKQLKKNDGNEKKGGLPTDSNLRLAIILGIIGVACLITETLIGGGIFGLAGAILIVVGLVFLILWAVNQ